MSTTGSTKGSYNFTGIDSTDNNLTNSNYDPVVITSTGKSGNAQKRMTMKIDAQSLPIDSAQVAMHAGSDIEFNNSTTNLDNWATSNDDIKITSATVNADIAAADQRDTSGVNGINTGTSTWPRAMPNNTSGSSSYAFSTYNTSGTTINASSIPTGNTELINNPAFDSNASGWTTYGGCVALRTTFYSNSSPASLWIADLDNVNAGPAQDVTANMITGNTYAVSTRLFSYGSSCNARLQLVVQSSGNGTQTFNTSWVSCSTNNWRTVSGTITPTWTGTLISAQLRINTDDNHWFFVDDVSMLNSSLASNTLYITNRVLTETYNPYGTTNTSGIYLINCGGKGLQIRNCRIRGTLIVTNSTGVNINQSLNWEPVVLGYPAIMSTAAVTVNMNSTTVNENTLGVNLNPSGAPYNGSTNTTAADTYPSQITGILYSTGNITFQGTNTILGSVISQADIFVNGTSTTINYWEEILKNPPPGFTNTTPFLQVVPGSYRSISN
jgi:hypothetical protein